MALHRKKCVRIAAWERDSSGKQSIRCFGFGDQIDAEKEPKKRAGEIEREGNRRKAWGVITKLRVSPQP